MTTDVLDRLRAADPARALDPPPPDELLRRLIATPRRRRRRRLLPAAVVTATVAAAALLLVPGGSTDLAARAYAQTAPEPDAILHTRTTVRTALRIPGRDKDTVSSQERWQQGERWRAITHFEEDDRTLEEVRGADGVLRFSDGETARREDGGDARDYIDRRASGFIAEFRRDYETGRLQEVGDAIFAGRPARRYTVTWPGMASKAEYFLDAETGLPLGSRVRWTLYGPKRAPGGRITAGQAVGHETVLTTVDALEHLPASEENLAKLAG